MIRFNNLSSAVVFISVVIPAVGCTGTSVCDDDGEKVPGVTCQCATSYDISHPCCQGEYVEGPTSADLCVITHSDGTFESIPRSEVGGSGDPEPEAPAIDNGSPVIDVNILRAVQIVDDYEIQQVGVPADTPFEIRWAYINRMATELRPSADYAYYQALDLDGPQLSVQRGIGLGSVVVAVRNAEWGTISSGDAQPKSETMDPLEADSYLSQLLYLPNSVNQNNAVNSFDVYD